MSGKGVFRYLGNIANVSLIGIKKTDMKKNIEQPFNLFCLSIKIDLGAKIKLPIVGHVTVKVTQKHHKTRFEWLIA